MGELLETVQAEIASAEARLSKLREMEGLARSLNGSEPEPPKIPTQRERPRGLAPAPKKPPAQQGRDGLSAMAQRALEAIRDAGEITPRALRDLLAIPENQRRRFRASIQPLVERELIIAEGTTHSRVYKALPRGPGHERVGPKGPAPSLTASRARKAESVEGRTLDAIVYRGGTISEIAHRLQVGTEEVGRAVRKLEREGEVKSRNADGQLYSVKSLAKKLNISERQAWKLVRGEDGKPPKIPSFKMAGNRRVAPEAVDEYLRSLQES
jgi:hypothetical protein